MPTVAELMAQAQTGLGASLRAGLENIDLNQQVTFTLYQRVVLPLDGYVFWVRADLLKPGALGNSSPFGSALFGGAPRVREEATKLVANGSLHYATERTQEEAETATPNAVVFTSEQVVDNLNTLAPDQMWLTTLGDVRVAFSRRQSFYRQANLYHYLGTSIRPTRAAQIIDSPAQLDTASVVVSNSLPIWLSLVNPTPLPTLPGLGFPLFPSFAVPQNEAPPFGAVHVVPESLRALQAFPVIGPRGEHIQLVSERVRITLYGTRNGNALDIQDYVFNFSEITDAIGIMNMPVVRDDKEVAPELNLLTMRKTIEFEVSYYQFRARDIARQMIETVVVGEIVGPPPSPPPQSFVWGVTKWGEGVWSS